MKKWLCCTAVSLVFSVNALSQHIHTISGGEIIFQSALVEQNGNDVNTNLRFTMWIHAGEYVHLDLGDHVGLFSGIGLRNVGFITEEEDIRVKYRSYNLGVPIALKLGSFRRNIYLFGGAEYEWMVHFKQKVLINKEKIKYSKWFSNNTPRFIPSAFAGFQFPRGVQVKFRYYLDNFLNHEYKGEGQYRDYTGFTKSQVWYISVSFMVKNRKIKAIETIPVEMAGL